MIRRTILRVATLTATLVSLSSISSAYYYWTFFPNTAGPFQPYPAKFDLNALPDKTVSYFISDKGPGKLVDGDNYDALVSQVRLAAEAWNGVASSDIRIRFGGFIALGTAQATPGIDVVFDDDMPPGILAQTKPTVPNDVGDLTKGPGFVPILRSKLQLRSDLTVKQQASYSDAFFMTMVHEFGHSLGLQHSTVSATMSTSATRATTKARPLAADDIAAISLLYPVAGWAATTGSIGGRVALNGTGVNLASVTALSANGTAVSALTNPDGSYRIDGIPPGDYYIYTQPLPPPQQDEFTPAAIAPPSDSHSGSFPAFTNFAGQFFPHTRDWTQAAMATVKAGALVPAVNFDVDARPGQGISNMSVLGYLGPTDKGAWVHAPPLGSGYRGWIVFTAAGSLIPGTTSLTSGLSMSTIGPAARLESQYLGYYTQGYLITVVDVNQVSQPTPVALAVTTPNDLYVLPAAFTVVPSNGPTINSVSGATDSLGNANVTIKGDNLSLDTRVLFDGAPATSIQKNDDGSFTVAAPPAIGSHVAVVEALANDGQTSVQTMGSLPQPTFTYASPDHPAISITPGIVNAGTDTMIEVDGVNTNFTDGQTTFGFGSSDISVRRIWILDRGKALLNISINPWAVGGLVTVTAATGIQTVPLTAGLQIQPAVPQPGGAPTQPMTLRVPVLNLATGLAGVPTGGTAVIGTSGLPASLSGWTLTIGGARAEFTIDGNSVIRAVVPAGVALGPTVVKLTSPNADPIAPILMNIDAQPPTISAAYDLRTATTAVFVDAQHPATPGAAIWVDVARLYGGGSPVPASSVHINVGGVDHVATLLAPILQFGLLSDIVRVQFTLSSGLPSGAALPMTVRVGTRVSPAYTLNVIPPAPVQPSRQN